ncbi:MAG: Rid family detoxifying hydrolase [Acidobacteria bacterium]|nr:Rid family detoxifying hydrolase [Nitrospiraceae bacterium]MCI0625134.1 Rid family detoxifying hydrolase [Acidobacteriota bacterium]MCI0717861.1 Rid family detoxifying hydrolase [Acidobacteriota bacterium]
MNKGMSRASLVFVLGSVVFTPSPYEADRKVIRPVRPDQPPAQSSAPRLGGILSPGIMTGDTLYCAGAGSRDPKTGEHPEGFEAQVKQSLENLGAVLKGAGLDFSDVVNSNVYLTDIKNFQAMNKVYITYFPQKRPARTTIAVPALPGGSHVEITFIASRNKNRKHVYPAGVKPDPTVPYSGGVIAGDLFYLSGQGSRHYKTKEFPQGEIEAHVKQTMDNLGAILKAGGMDFSHVVKTNIYLTDMNNFQRMNEVYKTYFKSDPPARTTVGVDALPGEPPIEITFIASKSKKAGQNIVRPEGDKPNPILSPAVQIGSVLFPSGKAGFAEGGIEAQVKEVMDGLGQSLKAGGMDFSNVVEAKVYLADIKNYGRMNEVYRSYFKSDPPARTCIAISKLVRDSQVEITFVAAK